MVDVHSLNESLNKHDKFWRICFFCDPSGSCGAFQFNCLLSTNCANIGIDNHTVDHVFRFQLPRDLPTFFQESGRGSRERGRQSTTRLFVDLTSYANLKRQILGSEVSEDDEFLAGDAEALALVGYNSALTPLKEKAKKRSQKARTRKKQSKYALSLPWKRRLRQRRLKELHEVASFVALNNGCWHVLKEWYLFSGKFERPPPFARI